MKASRRTLIAVLCPLLAFGLLFAVQGCRGGGQQQSQAEAPQDEAQTAKEQAEEAAEEAVQEVGEAAEEAGEAVAHIAGYVCPMHPESASLEPGKCSACNMDLEEAALHYTCTMCGGHAHAPGKCACGMDLVLRPVPDAPPPEPMH